MISNTVKFLAYKPNGEIVNTGFCLAKDLHLQDVPGCTIKEGAASIGQHYVDSNGTIQEIPYKPTEHSYFNYENQKWVWDSVAAWKAVRAQRDRLCAESDWTQLPDVSTTIKEKWAVYRQELRDITKQPDPFNIIWPRRPE